MRKQRRKFWFLLAMAELKSLTKKKPQTENPRHNTLLRFCMHNPSRSLLLGFCRRARAARELCVHQPCLVELSLVLFLRGNRGYDVPIGALIRINERISKISQPKLLGFRLEKLQNLRSFTNSIQGFQRFNNGYRKSFTSESTRIPRGEIIAHRFSSKLVTLQVGNICLWTFRRLARVNLAFYANRVVAQLFSCQF